MCCIYAVINFLTLHLLTNLVTFFITRVFFFYKFGDFFITLMFFFNYFGDFFNNTCFYFYFLWSSKIVNHSLLLVVTRVLGFFVNWFLYLIFFFFKGYLIFFFVLVFFFFFFFFERIFDFVLCTGFLCLYKCPLSLCLYCSANVLAWIGLKCHSPISIFWIWSLLRSFLVITSLESVDKLPVWYQSFKLWSQDPWNCNRTNMSYVTRHICLMLRLQLILLDLQKLILWLQLMLNVFKILPAYFSILNPTVRYMLHIPFHLLLPWICRYNAACSQCFKLRLHDLWYCKPTNTASVCHDSKTWILWH